MLKAVIRETSAKLYDYMAVLRKILTDNSVQRIGLYPPCLFAISIIPEMLNEHKQNPLEANPMRKRPRKFKKEESGGGGGNLKKEAFFDKTSYFITSKWDQS